MRPGTNVGPTLFLNSVGIYQVGGPFPHVRQDVSVAAQRHGRIRMTEYIRHGPNVHSTPDHEGSCGALEVGVQGALLLIQLSRTSQQSVKAKFAEFTLPALQ